ncbi:CAAX protease self-immunity [Bifidobacterium bohemicum]|uniref:CAAX amino terminal protease n=1 Tax=Bifidobacterium bohemicum DSM 22767 TaxID=1437606 RepID=A0A086ZK84_9BIFI|nr:CPBP family intramembrane glutamic endopeptidase [Bifidobacterium bohemicum]KFI46934.1 CAAX amino terminal protease [Bifidobacterium bohemicum DSM 22767]SCB85521.1 CAAX protease self-immunity [Bifidobacterium bohemicum]
MTGATDESVNENVDSRVSVLTAKKAVGRAASFVLAWMLTAGLAGGIVMPFLSMYFDSKGMPNMSSLKVSTAASLIGEPIGSAIVLLYWYSLVSGSQPEYGNRSSLPTHRDTMNVGRLIMIFVLLGTVLLIESGLDQLSRSIIHLSDLSIDNPMDPLVASAGNTWFVWLLMCIVSPVCEELVFRGAILRTLRQYGEMFAIVTSSVLFGLGHMNIYQLPVIFSGLLFGYVACRYSIKYSILLHIVINILASLSIPDSVIWVVEGICAVVAIIVYLKTKGCRAVPWIPDEPHVYRAWRSPLFLVTVAFMVSGIVSQFL